MFGDKEKEIWSRLDMPYEAVAVKFSRNRPEGYELAEETGPLCAFLAQAQKENKPVCISVDNETCMGKVVMGMTDLEDNHGSGQVGCELGAFRSPAANARLYYEAPMIKRNTVHYVLFCPLQQCNFTPDLIICVADTASAAVILRASSYASGDVWESKCSFVMSCSWTYVYPYLSGKVNHLFTGMHLGLQLAGVYPPGLHILSIPYQKIDEVTKSLDEMDWAVEDKPEVMERMDALRNDPTLPIELH